MSILETVNALAYVHTVREQWSSNPYGVTVGQDCIPDITANVSCVIPIIVTYSMFGYVFQEPGFRVEW